MSKNVTLSHAHQSPYVPTSGKASVYLLLELNAKEMNSTNRAPINLSLVLDRSGSMSGSPLEYCKEASKFVVTQLSEQDRMSMVIFDDSIDTVFPPQPVTHKDHLKHLIEGIETRGITNLSGGLIQGCQHVVNQKGKDHVNRVLLLSDGMANAGITDPEKLKKVAEDYHAAGTVITTMGVSDHFDEELMEGIADAGKGNFYFIDKVEEIPDIFAKELEGLLSVVAQNITLTIKPKKGAEIHNVFGYQEKHEEDGVRVSLGDIFSKETKSVLIECALPAGDPGTRPMFDVEWSFVDVTDGVKEYSCSYQVPFTFTNDLEKLSEASSTAVDKQVEITQSAQKLEQALQLFDEGNLEEGKDLLYANAQHLQSYAEETGDEEILKESATMLDQLEHFEFTKHTRKALHAEKYRQMKRRRK
ncbi:VWA domain-containing protein [Thalassobacillus hwangdonensis]|uniref:VWA domain-containing protein n=1 Tax=Thalassobacillus hwangdonensis TaxID=546108 RepID=A0ABW3L1W4_9BACI